MNGENDKGAELMTKATKNYKKRYLSDLFLLLRVAVLGVSFGSLKAKRKARFRTIYVPSHKIVRFSGWAVQVN